MDVARFILPASALLDSGRTDGRPLIVLDLAQEGPIGSPALPPMPVIGFGPSDHPAAGRLDALAGPDISLDTMVAGILRAPVAAAAGTMLLREGAGLTEESLAYGGLQGGAEHGAWLAAREDPEPSEPGKVHLERHGDVLTAIIDRPGARNAIDRAVRDGLREAFELAAIDREIARVRLRSVGAAFSIGGDLAEFGTTRDPAEAHLIRLQTLPAWALLEMGGRLDVHVQGACIGAGIEMAAFAARISAGPQAWFQLPELAMGLIPGAGGTVSIPRRIGRQRTAAMLFSGRRIGARTALDWGLIDEIVNEPAIDPG